MRVVIACAVVVLSVLAALGLAQTQGVFSSVTGRIPGTSATAATQSAEPANPAVVAKDQERQTTTSLNMAVVTTPTTSPVTTAPATSAAAPVATPAPAPVAAAPAAPAEPAKSVPQVFAQAPA